MKYRLIFALIPALLSACAGTKLQPDSAPKVAAPVQAQTQQPVAESPSVNASTAPIENKKIAENPLNDPSNILYKRSVYFAFDKFDINPEFRSLIEAHAKYLSEHPNASVRLEGNADDRGSREYNLSLGQKRAVAVKNAMNIYGVSDKQIETVSFGEEKPKALGDDETSWAENRRADITYSVE
ncbi:MAG: peptidoglycan-associated lipoprotein Pal [Methylotenera sp.]|uniref:peptidoglycan-associated lipoprotein Pal n=1 Tax=Methylotenera sp. TaxID=2051956 RepID=UPI00248928D8|nr:peptidoglycan-associated lipoprotein Pal [Methylotenera sp.]MDI1309291.1 peptidoglycan-associated lipoprotein Pal [Methylotenera sp.]